MKIIRTNEATFEEIFQKIIRRGKVFDEDIRIAVKGIVEDVAVRKDQALFEYTKKYDGYTLSARTVAVTSREMELAINKVCTEDIALLRLAVRRIEKFHRAQVIRDWFCHEKGGIELGLRALPLARVGIYVPGGRASYPSTVIMAAVPARIAGVKEIVLVTPCKRGRLNPLIAAAAHMSGVNRIFKVGGAQAVAALAYGTESIPRVDKIVGPGNAYVSAAKKMVYGQVAVDMIAGPSEIVVIADETADASFVASDLIAQAEHDELASAILLTPDESLAARVVDQVEAKLKTLQRKSVAERSLSDFGAVILTGNMEEAIAIANRFAPEHLELMVKNARDMVGKIKHAGAVFLGHDTPEVLGDYLAGPNHILPTGGTARFASPLGVYDFIRRSSVLSFSAKSLRRYAKQAAKFAKLEGLDGHGKAITVRISRKKS